MTADPKSTGARRPEPGVLVSVIAPCRNERAHIEGFLRDLSRQRLSSGVQMEVLVADGRSTDGTREWLDHQTESLYWLTVIDNPSGCVSKGLNLAIHRSRGEVIVRMDVHTRYSSDYVSCCLEALSRSGAANVGGPARTQGHTIFQRAVAAGFSSRFFAGGSKHHDPAYEGEVDTVPYGCWRRGTLLRTGLFDPDLIRSQDSDLNFRIRRQGGRIWQTPRIRSWYEPRSSLAALARQYFEYGFWKWRVIRKHRRAPAWRQWAPAGAACLLTGAVSLSPFFAAALWMLAALLACYLVSCLAATARAASRAGSVSALLLPLVFLTVHVSWTAGFVWAVGCELAARLWRTARKCPRPAASWVPR